MTRQNADESESVRERFLEYVRIDSRSDSDSPRRPSTSGKIEFAALLEAELARAGRARNQHSRGEFLVVDELLALPGILMDLIKDYGSMDAD